MSKSEKKLLKMSDTKAKASDASSTGSNPPSSRAGLFSTSTLEAAPTPAAAPSSEFADHVRAFNSLFSGPKPQASAAPHPFRHAHAHPSRPFGHVLRRSDLNAMLARLDALELGLAEWKRTTREHMRSAGAELGVQRFRQDRADGDYPRLAGYIAEMRRETAGALNNHTEALRAHRALVEELRGEVRRRDEALEGVMRWIAAAQRTGRVPDGAEDGEGPDSRGPR